MGERWLPVVGYEGLYEVSDLGRVRGCARSLVQISRWGLAVKREWPARVLAPTIDKGRYAYGRLQVKLCGHGRQVTRLVHHLVAEAFIGPRPKGKEVAHFDGIASNNRLDNLRYATPLENQQDQVRHGTAIRGERVGVSKLTESQVIEIRSAVGVTVQSIADQYGISIAQVSRIRNLKRWGHVAS